MKINSYDSALPLVFRELSTSAVFISVSFLFIFESFFSDVGILFAGDLDLNVLMKKHSNTQTLAIV